MNDKKNNIFSMGDLWLAFLIGFIAGATLVSVLIFMVDGSIP